MMLLAFILFVALLIPIIAIVVDSPLGRSVARRLEGGTGSDGGGVGDLRDLRRKVEVLETEVEDLTRSLSATREELQFMQRLLENPKKPLTP
jgi:hypothetical protein